MNDNSVYPTPLPTVVNNNITYLILSAFIYINGLLVLYYTCYKRELNKNQNKVTPEINFDKYFTDNMIDIEDDDLCSICLSNFDNKDIKILKCNHFFHNDCIIEWLQVKEICPNCKLNLKTVVNGTEV